MPSPKKSSTSNPNDILKRPSLLTVISGKKRRKQNGTSSRQTKLRSGENSLTKTDEVTPDKNSQDDYISSPPILPPSPTHLTSSSFSDTSDDELPKPVKFTIKPLTTNTSHSPNPDDEYKKIPGPSSLFPENLRHTNRSLEYFSSKNTDNCLQISDEQIFTGNTEFSQNVLTNIVSIPVKVDDIDPRKYFPVNDEFNRLSLNSEHEENVQPRSLTPSTDNKNTTSLSSIENDGEVANSFPSHNSSGCTSQYPISAPDSLALPPTTSGSASPIGSLGQGTLPITVSTLDQIPLAVAFKETIHVKMFGENQQNWSQRVFGEMSMSFPAVILNMINNSSPTIHRLEFRLKNSNEIDNVQLKSLSILCDKSNELFYYFDMIELNRILLHLQETSLESRFFNLPVLSYEIKQSDALIIPIELSSKWKRTINTISVNITYRFTSSGFPNGIRLNNENIIVYTIIDDGEKLQKSTPDAQWSSNEQKLWWKIDYAPGATGNLAATIVTQENDQPLTASSIVNVHFLGENGLFSSVSLDLLSKNYRVSLLKKQIFSGTYQEAPDQSEPLRLFQRASIVD